MAGYTSLEQVLATLRTQVNEATLGPIYTRIMLRTGVNLRAPRPDQQSDASLIAKVVSNLTEMGYSF